MHRLTALLGALLSALTLGAGVMAQTTDSNCGPLIELALTQLDSACAGLERNSACYGNTLVEAEFSRVELAATFTTPGDRAGIDELVSLHTSPLDTLRNQWGIAALSVQANLPDVLPGQNVVLVLIGDVDLQTDPEVASSSAPPMQTVRVSTDFRQSRLCEEAPRSLVLAQGPRDVRVDITVNGLNINLGSTIVIYLNEENTMWVATVDGDVRMEGVYPIPEGFGARVQLNAEGRAERVLEVRPLTHDEIASLAPLSSLPPSVLNYPIDLSAFSSAAPTATPSPTPRPTQRPATRPPIRPTLTPTATPTATLTATPTALPPAIINVGVDNPVINYGDCTFIRWQTEYIDSIYFNEEGVVGVGERQVCPLTTTTYVIRVRLRDGTDVNYPITVSVSTPMPQPTMTDTWTPMPPTQNSLPVCGNLICEAGETTCNCSTDCPGLCIP